MLDSLSPSLLTRKGGSGDAPIGKMDLLYIPYRGSSLYPCYFNFISHSSQAFRKDSNPVDEHCGETFKQIEESSEVKITHKCGAAIGGAAAAASQTRNRHSAIMKSGARCGSRKEH